MVRRAKMSREMQVWEQATRHISTLVHTDWTELELAGKRFPHIQHNRTDGHRLEYKARTLWIIFFTCPHTNTRGSPLPTRPLYREWEEMSRQKEQGHAAVRSYGQEFFTEFFGV